MEIVIRASVIFLVLWALTRGLRRRALSNMAPFEMLLLVVIGDIIQQGVTQEDSSVTGAVLAVGTFAFWITAWSWLSYRWDGARRVLEGVPLVIVSDGQPVPEALQLEQVPMAEVLEAARQHGIEDLADVRLAVLEPSGLISFIKRDPGGDA
ncbi:MAG: DUF421 domain-containing protein [Acidimicrobiia bacterium]|nr:DUF421 domain-containing protein [Acidimicrobiia bacterium]